MNKGIHSKLTPAQREQQFTLLVDAVIDYAIFVLSTDGIVMTWNRGAQRLKGYKPEEIIGSHFSRFYPPEEANGDKPAQELATALSEGHYEEEGWRIRKDGSRFWANVILTPLYDDQHNHLGFAKVTRDFSERRSIMEALRQSEERFRLLIEAVKDYAIFILDPTGHVVTWNEGAQRSKGYLASEIIGRHFSTFYTAEDRASGKPADILHRATSEGRVEDEGWRVRKDGSRFWANVILTAIYDANKKLIGFAKVTRDVTDRKKAQETIENKQKQINELQKMEAIGQLAGGVAHDFNNLIAGIQGCAEGLREMTTDEGVMQEITEIQKACERAATLTRQLMAFSRRQIVSPKRVNLNQVIGEMEKLARRLIGAQITIDLQFDPHLKPVKVDEGQLEQVILNLILNARDAMPQGGKLVVTTRNITVDNQFFTQTMDLTPGEYIMLTVADNGLGMTPEVQARIFEPFFTTKEVGKGTGLGLATVYGIVKQNNGGIMVYSQPGMGTSMKIFLPMMGEGFVGKPESVSQESENFQLFEGHETILVVEDDPLVLRNTVRGLQARGYVVLSAQNAADAIQLFERTQGQIKLLLTDVMMPGMNGKELAHALHEKSGALPILYMSGYASEIIAQHGLLTHDIDFLEKPFMAIDLAKKIRQILDRSENKPLRF